MTGQIVIQSSPSLNNRRQPLLSRENSLKVGELAGSAAAECAAVCCCCPCALMGCFVLTVYKVPFGICRRIWRNRISRKKNKKKNKEIALLSCGEGGGGGGGGSSKVYCLNDNNAYISEIINAKGFESVKVSIDGSAEVVDLDREMWEQFRNTGFWRSPSQRYL